jgi:hypothetical protein
MVKVQGYEIVLMDNAVQVYKGHMTVSMQWMCATSGGVLMQRMRREDTR